VSAAADGFAGAEFFGVALVKSPSISSTTYLVRPYGLVMPAPAGEASVRGATAKLPYTVAELEKMSRFFTAGLVVSGEEELLRSISCNNTKVLATLAS